MKKKIGISYTETNFQNYLNWFNKQDIKDDIELIELSFLKNNTNDIYKCDGFILTGGVDVHPSLYGGNLEYENKPKAFEPERDEFEEKIYKYSQENKKPLLGICRGLQLVNVLQGGQLIQDLDTDRNIKHCRIEETDGKHDIRIDKNTLLHDIALCDSGNINSAHHQAIDPDAIGDNLIVNAYDDCEEELIEGIEFKDKTNKAFMLCVQWHPERMPNKQSILSDGIKNSFLKAVRSPSLNGS
ncbi:MAG: gamma-glutamyl-gamma-aminobutyrate hydrolase family protein [Segetibacter sp.]